MAAGAPPNHTAGFTRGAQLADVALQTIRAAGADTNPRARAQLLSRTRIAVYGDPNAGAPQWWTALLHTARNSRLLRMSRRVNPAWWRRRAELAGVRLEHQVADTPEDLSTITAHLNDDPIANATYQLCVVCRHGRLCKISIDDDHQGLGLGTRIIDAIIATAPADAGYTWSTTMHYDTATGFWRTMHRRHRVGFTHGDRPGCPHMQ